MSQTIAEFVTKSGRNTSFWLQRDPNSKWTIVRYRNGIVITSDDSEFGALMSRQLIDIAPVGGQIIRAMVTTSGDICHVSTLIKSTECQYAVTTDDGIADAIAGMNIVENLLRFAVKYPYNSTDDEAHNLAGELSHEVRGTVETNDKLRKTFAKIIVNRLK